MRNSIIFELLKDLKITQKKFAEDINVSTGNVSDWKSGKSSPSASVLNKIANYFGVSVDYLLGITDIKKPLIKGDEELTEYLSELESREELRIFFRLISKAAKEDVEKAIAVVEAMFRDAETKD